MHSAMNWVRVGSYTAVLWCVEGTGPQGPQVLGRKQGQHARHTLTDPGLNSAMPCCHLLLLCCRCATLLLFLRHMPGVDHADDDAVCGEAWAWGLCPV